MGRSSKTQAFDNANRGEFQGNDPGSGRGNRKFRGQGHGISKEALSQLYATQPILRSSVFQQMMLEFREIQNGTAIGDGQPAPAITASTTSGHCPIAGERSTVDLSELQKRIPQSHGQSSNWSRGAKLSRRNDERGDRSWPKKTIQL